MKRFTLVKKTLPEKALEGAASQGAETGIVHLYDLSLKKAGRRQTVFPEDCSKAWEMGIRCARPIE